MTTGSAPARANHFLEQLFPDDTVTVVDVRYRSDQEAPPLEPQLAPLISQAVESRRREFSYGRWCASVALDGIGSHSRVVGRGPDRAPVWPTGTTGSISHTTNYAVAVAAQHLAGRGLGIDAERKDAVGDDILPDVLTAEDEAQLSAMDDSRRSELIAVAFSAKEALFKAQFPLSNAWVGFDEVHVASIRSQAPELGGALLLVPMKHSVLRDTLIWPIAANWRPVDDLIVVGVSASRHTARDSDQR